MRLLSKLKDLWGLIHFGKNPAYVKEGSIIIFPSIDNTFNCGIAALVSVKKKEEKTLYDIEKISLLIKEFKGKSYKDFDGNLEEVKKNYLGGSQNVSTLAENVSMLKRSSLLFEIFADEKKQKQLSAFAKDISKVIDSEADVIAKNMGRIPADIVTLMSDTCEQLKDISWTISSEILDNIAKIKILAGKNCPDTSCNKFKLFKNINSVLNSIDRLEVRGRDSAGISVLFILEEKEFKRFHKIVEQKEAASMLDERLGKWLLLNGSIDINSLPNQKFSVALVYKYAAEIGKLGDNTTFLRDQIKNDPIMHIISDLDYVYDSVLAHTRWASMGAISEPNCHPIDSKKDNKEDSLAKDETGIIHVSLNGDIDNFQRLLEQFSDNDIAPEITTDTKIIPLIIQKNIENNMSIEEAFRAAVNMFEGSHAIAMHTDLAAGKFFIAKKGSGQAMFIGISDELYMPASEVYGFVEETSSYIKLGDKLSDQDKGTIAILDQNSKGKIEGIKVMTYDGQPIALDVSDIKQTKITSRDIDRRGFEHYFLKEISQSPYSVQKTLEGRWKFIEQEKRYTIDFDDRSFPKSISEPLSNGEIKRIIFTGQGTAGVAACVCANIAEYYIKDHLTLITGLKSSELSGFKIDDDMTDTLVVAITQSGTTTDTNKAVDMAKEKGAHTIAIVNRRDSDITFKTDAVMYTSGGRDIEMSVASTKAFYSQIAAGAILSLYIAKVTRKRDDKFISDEIQNLLAIPEKLNKVLSASHLLKESATEHAGRKTYWAAVGSGMNKPSADEIRIKLSELCYKTISSDYIEDKKHIDLSSEPLIIVCAAGSPEKVAGDIVKDVAIFKAHKALSIVIADEGDQRFDPYAAFVFHVPKIKEHLAPILNTLAGHIWGYYAALAINEGSKFLYNFREEVKKSLIEHEKKGLNFFNLILEKHFRKKIVQFYRDSRTRHEDVCLSVLDSKTIMELGLLLRYLADKMPAIDFEYDFDKKGTAANILETFFYVINRAINQLARPIDAIKHQAKTVTVGTSRIIEKFEGILFDAVFKQGFTISELSPKNINMLKNLQEIISEIRGEILYKVQGLDILGDPNEKSSITIIKKSGVLKSIPSMVEKDHRLKGTKRIIAKQKNVYIGMGKKDKRNVIIVPISSKDAESFNHIDYILLMNIGFKQNVPIKVKIKALGGKYEKIKDFVQENIEWKDKYLDLLDMKELFGLDAIDIWKEIVKRNE